jgi:hypothetical protein
LSAGLVAVCQAVHDGPYWSSEKKACASSISMTPVRPIPAGSFTPGSSAPPPTGVRVCRPGSTCESNCLSTTGSRRPTNCMLRTSSAGVGIRPRTRRGTAASGAGQWWYNKHWPRLEAQRRSGSEPATAIPMNVADSTAGSETPPMARWFAISMIGAVNWGISVWLSWTEMGRRMATTAPIAPSSWPIGISDRVTSTAGRPKFEQKQTCLSTYVGQVRTRTLARRGRLWPHPEVSWAWWLRPVWPGSAGSRRPAR